MFREAKLALIIVHVYPKLLKKKDIKDSLLVLIPEDQRRQKETLSTT